MTVAPGVRALSAASSALRSNDSAAVTWRRKRDTENGGNPVSQVRRQGWAGREGGGRVVQGCTESEDGARCASGAGCVQK